MTRIGQYLLLVICAGFLCAIVGGLFSNKSLQGRMILLICGLLLSVTVISPFADFQLPDFDELELFPDSLGQHWAEEGKNQAQEEYRKVILQRFEAYILDKAESLEAKVSVRVELDEENYYAPRQVTIQGSVSPYAKKLLSTWLTQELGLSKEDQVWIG